MLPAGTRASTHGLWPLPPSAGAAEVTVVTTPPARRAVLDGDELVMPGEPLPPGAIYNSNRFLLRGLLKVWAARCSTSASCPTARCHFRAALRDAAAQADLIVTSGGVSVGEEDHLRPAVQAEGRLTLWALALKPASFCLWQRWAAVGTSACRQPGLQPRHLPAAGAASSARCKASRRCSHAA